MNRGHASFRQKPDEKRALPPPERPIDNLKKLVTKNHKKKGKETLSDKRESNQKRTLRNLQMCKNLGV